MSDLATLLATALATTQLLLLALLCVFGLHRAWLAVVAFRVGRGSLSADHLPAPITAAAWGGDHGLPTITVQLPIYNERAVAQRLLRSVAALDYPRDKLQIQVLDDSDDDTTDALRQELAALAKAPHARDLEIAHLRRPDRQGYKAGALRWGLHDGDAHRARGEFIAMFDADFVPPPDFLRRSLGPFRNPAVGMVQARWEHLDAEFGLLTRIQALLLDGHFAVEHVARAGAGHLFNFNGTAGLFRRRTIDDAGGWLDDTLTEDMDLSYRAQLRGWTFAYLPGLTCPAELPVDPGAFLNQQHRWAKGGIQTARKHLRPIWRSDHPLGTRVEATFHLLGNLAFPLLLLLILAALPLQLLRTAGHGPHGDFWGAVESGPLLIGVAGVLCYYAYGQMRLRRFDATTVILLPALLAVGAGLAVNNTVAVCEGMRRNVGAFVRTPKRAAVHKLLGAGGLDPWRYLSPRGWLPVAEIALGLWALTTAALSYGLGFAATAGFHGLFAVGLLSVGAGSLQRPAARRSQLGLPPAAHPRSHGT